MRRKNVSGRRWILCQIAGSLWAEENAAGHKLHMPGVGYLFASMLPFLCRGRRLLILASAVMSARCIRFLQITLCFVKKSVLYEFPSLQAVLPSFKMHAAGL